MNTEASEIEPVNGTPNPYLEISGLEFSYGEVKVLHGLEFQLVAESIGCVMGRNGVGKTTFLRNLVGLETPSQARFPLKEKMQPN